MISPGTAQGRYNKLKTERDPYLKRARSCSKLTIPTLIPEEGSNHTTDYPTPYQGIGARGVNNLAAKFLLALFPPNTPLFRMTIDDFQLEQMTQQKGLRAEVEQALGKIERAVQDFMEQIGLRVKMFEAIKHLLVAGNVLLYIPKDGKVRVFKLNNYVISRTPSGEPYEIITEESTFPGALSKEVIEACEVDTESSDGNPKPVSIYTVIQKVDNQWEVFQEINKKEVPNTRSSFPLDKSPWIPLRYVTVDNEDYGRSFVEEYLGDLKSHEGLSKAILEGSAAAAKVLLFVSPNGVTRKKDVEDSNNGAVVSGNAQDVTVLQLEKFADFRIANDMMNTIADRLAYAFMLNAAIQRNGERVTAEEIRFMAGEIEDALGGAYSTQSQEMQLPIVKRLIHILEQGKTLPKLPSDTVKPAIVTGLEALGRGHDLNKLSALREHISMFGEESLRTYVNVEDYITRVATALGIDSSGLVPTKEEVQQRQQENMLRQAAEKASPQIAKTLTQGEATSG